MHNDDTIQVPTWRPDTTPASPVGRALPKQPQPASAKPEVANTPALELSWQTEPSRLEPLTLEELAENLRRMNMTFDLFEIQAKFIIDTRDHDIKVIVHNTKTGEVIRSIPPTDFNALYDRFLDGLGTTFSSFV